MKKLMIGLVAASATIFAFGGLPSGTSFEDYATGEKTIAQLTDYEDDGVQTSGDRYWFYEGDKTAAIGAITNGTPDAPSRPAQFAGNSNLQYLDLTASDATNVLYRAVNSVSSEDVVSVATLAGQTIGNGLYLDTLVKFTPGELTSLELGDGDKIALTYVEETDDEDNDGKVLSNIVVRAGYVNGSTITPVNYVMNPIPGFSAAGWHRLTVRAINVDHEKAPVGFVVYVDDVEVTYDLEQEPGDSDYLAALAGNSIVANYLYNTEKHAFIPSAVSSEDVGFDALHAVGFKGNGCVDDISFTATPPTFIQEGTTVTIAWDANVTSYTVATNGTTMVDGEAVSGEGSANLLIADGTTTITVTATYNDANLMDGTWTVSAGTLSAGVWTGFASGATLTIKSLYPYFQVGDAYYQEFDGEGGALAAAIAGSGVIKLNADYSHDISIATEGDVTIDLAGKTITGDALAAIMNGGANLIITNSTVAIGRIVNPTVEQGEDSFAILIGGGTTSIYGGWVDGAIDFDTSEDPADLLFLYGGNYVDVNNATTIEAFYLKNYAEDDVSYVGDPAYYFQVGGSTPEPPAPTQINVPTAALNLVYDGTEQTGVAAGTGYTLSGTYAATDAGDYTATATLEEGYIWSDETTAPKEINWSIAADTSATVDVVLTSYIAEYSAQLEFPTATATIGGGAVTGTPAWNPDTISEPAAGATNDYTVTFTVTGGNYAGSTGTATFKVYKEASSGGWEPDPSKIDQDATAEETYSELAGTALATANAQKLTAWAAAESIDFAAVTGDADAYVDAFLLNCAPDEVTAEKAAFKLNITFDGDTVTVTGPDGKTYNAKVQLKGSNDLSTWTDVESASKSYQFFKAELAL